MKDGDLQEIHFRDLFDHATDLIHLASPEGIILYANLSWKETLGYESSEVIGNHIGSVITQSERKKFIETRNNLIKTGAKNGPVDTCFVKKDGEEVHVEGYIHCSYRNGQILYTHSILRDVTKRKTEERKLQEFHERIVEREANFNELIQHAPDAIIVIDEESRITLWNPKSEKIFGWKADEVKGRPLSETIIPEKYRERHKNGMQRYLTTGEIHVLNKTIEVTALNKDGDEFHIALTISRANNKGRAIFIAFIRDISEQKKMEEELQTQKQQLEKNNEELAQYASIASHDLKEPVRKLLTFSGMLLNIPYQEKEKMDYVLQRIQAIALRMKALIESISKFSSINQSATENLPVDLTEVINEVRQEMETEIKNKNAVFFISTLPAVAVNRIQLFQLFENLISNSLKYSKPGVQPVIEITGHIVENKFVEIIVSDNGLGFDNQYSQKIFQPFQRLHGSNFEGTGIGLAICKKIVDAHGGTIRATGIQGKGSKFSFTLPIGGTGIE